MYTESYEKQKSLLLRQFKELDLTDFSRSENQFYETLMEPAVISKFRVIKDYPLVLEIMNELTKSENSVSKLVFSICSTFFYGIDENIPIHQLRKDLYAVLHKIDLSKLTSEFLLVNELENPKHANIICNLIETLQTTHFKQTGTSPEKILKLKIRQQFRKENEGSYPLPMVEYNPLFHEFDDLLIKHNENLHLTEICGLKIYFEKVDAEIYRQCKTLAQKLTTIYKDFKITVTVISDRFTQTSLDLNSRNNFTPKLDLKEMQLNVSLEDAFRCHLKRFIGRIDL